MPWIKSKMGENVYVASLYSKDELPVFSEIYYYYLKGKYYYDKSTSTKMDPYWNIPVDKYLLMNVCNQLNKMIFEDCYKEKIIGKFTNINDIRFIIVGSDVDPSEFSTKYNAGSDVPPPIYTIQLPTGLKNPFIVIDHPRISNDELNEDHYMMKIMINGIRLISFTDNDFSSIMEIMMEKYIEYYKKLEEDGTSSTNRCITGYDPAK